MSINRYNLTQILNLLKILFNNITYNLKKMSDFKTFCIIKSSIVEKEIVTTLE
jgi:hypothetical protein